MISSYETPFLPYLFVLVTICFVFLVSYNFIDDKKLLYIFIFGFIFNIILLVIHNFVYQLPGSDADAVLYDLYGKEISDFFLNYSSEPPDISSSYYYSYFVGILYTLFGTAKIVPELMNSMLSVILIIIVYKLSYLLTEHTNVARLSAFIFLIFPTINLYSVFIMRETSTLFFFILSFYFLIKWNKNPRIRFIFYSISSLLLCVFFHDAFVFVGVAYITYFLIYNPNKRKIEVLSKKNLILIPLIGMVAIFFFTFLVNKLPNLSTLFSVDFLGEHVLRRSRDRASYLEGLKPRSYIDMGYQTPIRIIYFLFTPFPWMVTSSVDIFGLIDSLFFIILGFYSYKGLKYLKSEDKPIYYLLLIVLLVFLITFGWGTSNYGAAMRHRSKIGWLFIILASIGYLLKNNKGKRSIKK